MNLFLLAAIALVLIGAFVMAAYKEPGSLLPKRNDRLAGGSADGGFGEARAGGSVTGELLRGGDGSLISEA